MENFNEIPEELTEAMHATFTVSADVERQHRVWSAVEFEAEGYSVKDACRMAQVAVADFERLKHTYPVAEDFE